MKRFEIFKEVRNWGKDFCYSIENVMITDKGWLVIELNAITIIVNEVSELMKDIKEIHSSAELYSIDLELGKNRLSIWINL